MKKNQFIKDFIAMIIIAVVGAGLIACGNQKAARTASNNEVNKSMVNVQMKWGASCMSEALF